MTTQPDFSEHDPEISRVDFESAREHAFEADETLDDLPDDGYDDGYDDQATEYGQGWDDGYAYAQEHWLVWISLYRFMDGFAHWWTWRKAHLRWKLHDFRRWLKRQKTDHSDIPF